MFDRRAHIIVTGAVQGVGYRYFAYKHARAYNLKGYVKNLSDGRVEVVVEGNHGLIEEFIKELRRGPVSAHVTGVEVDWEIPTNEFSNFEITL
ncbi:MAG: acylphosphatase [Candidatus Kryptoniota bacterium]